METFEATVQDERARDPGVQFPEPEPPRDDPVGAATIERIRGLLIGNRLREVEDKFSALEARFAKESGEMRDEIRSRFESVELYVRSVAENVTERLGHSEAVIQRLNAEAVQDKEKLDRLSADVEQTDNANKQLMHRMDEESGETGEEMRKLASEIKERKFEIETLLNRLEAENAERKGELRRLSEELKGARTGIQETIEQLGTQTLKSEKDLRTRMLEQAKSLADEFRQRHEDTKAAMVRETNELRTGKADRAALATLFSELGTRLAFELGVKTSEAAAPKEKEH